MKFICNLCGYIYDEEKEKTSFSGLNEDYICPVCKAKKDKFSNIGKVYLVPTFHHDIAYLKSEEEYYKMASDILDKAIDIMVNNPQYIYTVEQVYFFRRYFNQNPQKQQILKDLYIKGQLSFAPGVFVAPDLCMPNGESLFMQATYGKRILEQIFGYSKKTVAFFADSQGHHGQIPQILTQSGYDYFAFSRAMDPNFDIENFFWRGLDGTLLKCHWMSTGYAGIFVSDSQKVNAEELKWEEANKKGIKNLQKQNAKHCLYDTQIIPIGGDMCMPSVNAVPMVDSLQKEKDFEKIVFSEFIDGLNDIDYNGKPIFDGEFISSLKGSYATNIKIKQWNNKLESLLYSLEALSVMKGQKIDLNKQWEMVLKNQFHDIIWGTICDQALEIALNEFQNTYNELMQKLAQLSSVGEKALFNPLPFSTKGVIGDKSYIAQPLSYAKVTSLQTKEYTLPCQFENQYYIAQIDKMGFITSLIEKQSGCQVVKGGAVPFGCLQMQSDNGDNWVYYEYPYEDNPAHYSTNREDPFDRSNLTTHRNVRLNQNCVSEAVVEKTQEYIRITQNGVLSYWATKIPFETTITLYNNSPRIDYSTALICQSKHLRIRVAFPVEVENANIYHQIPYGIVNRGEGLQPASMFMDCVNDKVGVSLINKGIPSNDTEGGIMMLTLFRSVAMEYKCPSQLSYNYGEKIVCDYAIMPHSASNYLQDLWQNALSFNIAPVETTNRQLNDLKVENAFISALRYDGEDIFIRIYNALSTSSTAKITLPNGYNKYCLANGLMEMDGDIVQNKTISFDLEPFKVQAFRLIK